MRLNAGDYRLMLLAACGLAAALVQTSSASAQANAREPLEIKLERSKVTMSGGKEALSSASTARPGEILQEVATYTNRSKAALTNIAATLPVPANTELLVDSIKPADAQASTDGRLFLSLPLKRKVKQANGVDIEQLVPMGEYKALRWQAGSLAAASSLVFSARFKVLDDSVATHSPVGGK